MGKTDDDTQSKKGAKSVKANKALGMGVRHGKKAKQALLRDANIRTILAGAGCINMSVVVPAFVRADVGRELRGILRRINIAAKAGRFQIVNPDVVVKAGKEHFNRVVV